MKILMQILVACSLVYSLVTGIAFAEEGHDDHGGHQPPPVNAVSGDAHQHADEIDGQSEQNDHEEGGGVVKLTSAMLDMGGIRVAKIDAVWGAKFSLYAPGEIVNNQYQMSVLSVQLDSKVLKRHVVLGEHVEQSQPIVTLFSNEMAELQQALMLSSQEWARVKALGRKTVGSKRYAETRLTFETAKSKARAGGMSQQAISGMLSNSSKYRLGEYEIIAPFEGVVLNDNFQQGQFLSAGEPLIDLVNEEELWVDVLIAPKVGQTIPLGSKAIVKVGGKNFEAFVIQENHAIDETTRTRKIRLSLQNENHLLHAGYFVDVHISLPLEGAVMLIPETALMRSSDGDWTVFVEKEEGQFEQKEVELINTSNGMHVIEGLKPGKRIVVEGAFFVASELAKSGFDPHNH